MIDVVIQQRRRNLGGFEVGRVLPFQGRRMVGPFIFFDHMGPVDFPASIPRSVDVRPHPHIGLSTITYLFAGEIMHRDSLGSEQPIRPSEVNWMTAGRGITHSERFERARREGGALHGIQSWIALPAEHEDTEPAFSHYNSRQVVVADEPGVRLRVIAGEAYGAAAQVTTYSPLFYVYCELLAGAKVALPDGYSERAVYVVSGGVEAAMTSLANGQMAVFKRGAGTHVKATTNSTLMLLGGEPIGERFIEWNFVSSSRDRIDQAKADWRAGRMKLPDGDNEEFIPLPSDSPRVGAGAVTS
jgi:redox-sensitive bicupin YhaK (pirin superfamily)